jgi:hypothetical protein
VYFQSHARLSRLTLALTNSLYGVKLISGVALGRNVRGARKNPGPKSTDEQRHAKATMCFEISGYSYNGRILEIKKEHVPSRIREAKDKPPCSDRADDHAWNQ